MYERVTLLHMREASKTETCKYWYVHTKGLRHFGTDTEANVVDWIRLMTYWNITNWKLAAEYLCAFHAYGCNFCMQPSPQFSGNFWWAASEHVRTLPDSIGDRYCDTELWLFQSSEIRFANIYEYCADEFHRFQMEDHDMSPHVLEATIDGPNGRFITGYSTRKTPCCLVEPPTISHMSS